MGDIQGTNPFTEDWRACLRAHYRHVVGENDVINESSLRTVLLQVGFSEDEIETLKPPPPELPEVVAEVEEAVEAVDAAPATETAPFPEPEPELQTPEAPPEITPPIPEKPPRREVYTQRSLFD